MAMLCCRINSSFVLERGVVLDVVRVILVEVKGRLMCNNHAFSRGSGALHNIEGCHRRGGDAVNRYAHPRRRSGPRFVPAGELPLAGESGQRPVLAPMVPAFLRPSPASPSGQRLR
jgi:hypothetical protein